MTFAIKYYVKDGYDSDEYNDKLSFYSPSHFSTSMVDDIKCEKLGIYCIEISPQATEVTIVCGQLFLENSSGNLSGLFQSLTRDKENSFENLCLQHLYCRYVLSTIW